MRVSGFHRVLGTMSGTSLDGVDAAILDTDGAGIAGFGPSRFRPYSEEERAVLRRALGAWPGDPGVAAATEIVEAAHREVVEALLAEPAAGPVEAVGFHGQTLAHEPGGRGTHQAGDGARLSHMLALKVVWDFRSEDMRRGGQGAPLAPVYHHALARFARLAEPVAFLNLGGVGNLTWVDPSKPGPEAEGAVLAFDTGPANAPLDDLMLARLGRPYDADGALAAAGSADAGVLEAFAAHPYFAKVPPKSLDRNDFPELARGVAALSDADAAATLTRAVALAAARGTQHFPAPVSRVLVTGGGRRNPVMMDGLAAALDCPVAQIEEIGIDGDMVEAQAFAFMAARISRGLSISFPSTTGVAAPTVGGRVSEPA